MVFRFDLVCDHFVHGTQSSWAKEYIAALRTHIGGYVTEKIQFAPPSVDMLHVTLFYASCAKWTLRHCDTLLRD